MITELQIRNFQTHRKFRIKFSEKVTTIVGPSDIGKSAIIRALRWVSLNQPQGDSFKRIGANWVSVRLFVDGHVIKRKRGKENTYELDGEVYKAFGNDPPAPIVDLLNVDELNFQDQHDSPFWFSLSSSEVSRQLNKVVDLGIIDHCLGKVSKQVRHLQTVVKVSEDRLVKAKEVRNELSWVREADRDWKQVESLEVETGQIQDRKEQLEGLVQTIQTTSDQVVQKQERAQDYDRVVSRIRALSVVADKTTSLVSFLQKLQRTTASIRRFPPDTTSLDNEFGEFKSVSERKRLLEELVQDLEEQEQRSWERREQAKELEKKLHKMLKGKCPICGGRVLSAEQN